MINNMVLGSTHLGEILSEVIVVGAQNKNVTSETISPKYRNNKYATICLVVHKSFDSRFEVICLKILVLNEVKLKSEEVLQGSCLIDYLN